jgi:hypothetical protein
MNDKNEPDEPELPASGGARELPRRGDAFVRPEQLPPPGPDDKTIHQRRPLRPVPEAPLKSPDQEP